MNTDRFALPDNAYDRGYALAEIAADRTDLGSLIRETATELVKTSRTVPNGEWGIEPYTEVSDLWPDVWNRIKGREIGGTDADLGDEFDEIEVGDVFDRPEVEGRRICAEVLAG